MDEGMSITLPSLAMSTVFPTQLKHQAWARTAGLPFLRIPNCFLLNGLSLQA